MAVATQFPQKWCHWMSQWYCLLNNVMCSTAIDWCFTFCHKLLDTEQWRTQEFCSWGSWEERARRTGIWGAQPPSQGFRSICKWVKPIFLLGCSGCIFLGNGNSAQPRQNFGISGGGEVKTPQTPSVRHWHRALSLQISPTVQVSLYIQLHKTVSYSSCVV
jgi:hypothetical protein